MVKEKIVRVNAALHPEILRRVDFYAEQHYEDRSTAIRQLIAVGLKEKMKDRILYSYKEGRLTMRQAAELLGVDYWEMQEILKNEDIPIIRTTEKEINKRIKQRF